MPAGADAATRAAASIDATLKHDPVVSYLGFLLNESGSSEAHAASAHETWLFSLRGETQVYVGVGGDATHVLAEGTCGVVPAGLAYSVKREAGALGLIASRAAALRSWEQREEARSTRIFRTLTKMLGRSDCAAAVVGFKP